MWQYTDFSLYFPAAGTGKPSQSDTSALLGTDVLCWKSGNFWGWSGWSVISLLCSHSLAMQTEKLLRYFLFAACTALKLESMVAVHQKSQCKWEVLDLTGGHKRLEEELLFPCCILHPYHFPLLPATFVSCHSPALSSPLQTYSGHAPHFLLTRWLYPSVSSVPFACTSEC